MAHDAAILMENMQKAAMLWPEIIGELAKCYDHGGDSTQELGTHISQAFFRYYQKRMQKDPVELANQQWNWWQRSMELWQQQVSSFMQLAGNAMEGENKKHSDRRFRGDAWQQSWLFESLKEHYLLASEMTMQAVTESQYDLDKHTAHIVRFYTQQWIDALSPSNYPWSNPEVMQRTLDTEGANLVTGLQNLLDDVKRGQISMTTSHAFELGKNIATTPAKVVYENELFQLLQYEPLTNEVYETPMLVIPAWINKYYILDLQEENSMVRWLAEQGYTVFVVSWVNPDERHRDFGFEDYMLKGAWEAVQAVQKATGQSSIHAAGYCLGGTLLSCLLSWLHSKGKQSAIASATFLTTLIDFSEAGDLKVFIDEPQISALEGRMAEKGYLEGREMAMTFNLLRPSDLIWSFVINNYMLGKEPLPFDLLYWNADSTRMPAKMHSFYLREMYLNNRLAQPGKLKLGGEAIDLTRITTPSYLLSAREDHIAPWEAAYVATQQYRGDITFVLAASGHIAGVVNPPQKKKYNYWTNEALPADPNGWLKDAKQHDGSWWPHWLKWVMPKSGKKIPARKPGDGALRVIEPAPGRYAKVRSEGQESAKKALRLAMAS